MILSISFTIDNIQIAQAIADPTNPDIISIIADQVKEQLNDGQLEEQIEQILT